MNSAKGSSSFRCHHGTDEGVLHPVRAGLVFVPKPLLFIPTTDITGMDISRGGQTGRTFDLIVQLRAGAPAGGKKRVVEFSMISSEHLPALREYVSRSAFASTEPAVPTAVPTAVAQGGGGVSGGGAGVGGGGGGTGASASGGASGGGIGGGGGGGGDDDGDDDDDDDSDEVSTGVAAAVTDCAHLCVGVVCHVVVVVLCRGGSLSI